MEEILNEIDKLLQATFKTKGLKAYGLCELVGKDGKQSPVSVNLTDKKRVVAEIHDRFKGIFYHRLLPGSFPTTEDEEFSFGVSLSKRFKPKVRTVVAYKTQLGEDFMMEFANAFPDRINTLTDYKFVFLNQGTLIADHEGVFNQEYGESHSYEKHRIAWNIFALEYDLDFILC